MRKIFSLLMAAVLSISTAFATTVYCKMTQSWWTQDGAAVGVHYWGGTSAGTAWPGVRMNPVSGEEGTWTCDVPADVEGLMFVRVNGSGDIADWGAKTANLTLPTDGKNLYTITSETPVWGDPGATGEWSVYGEEIDDEVLNAFPKDSTSFIGYAWGEDVTKNKVIFDANNYIMMFSQGNNLQINANYGLQIGNSSKQSAFVFRLDEEADLKVGIARNGSDMTASLYYMGETIDTLTAANLATGGSLCSSVNIAADHQSDVLVKTKAAAGYYKVLGSLRFCCPYIVVTKNNVPPVAAKFYVTGDSALVTDAGFAGQAWNPAAIKAEADTLVLNLKAEQYYKLKVTTDGTWNTAKGFNNLSEKPQGVTMDNDENIIFSLAEAGAVQVIYIAGETPIFKIAGNFYVEPTPDPAKFYITGDSALLADAAGDASLAWNPAAIKAEADTLVLNLKAEQYYKLKVTADGTWNTAKGFNDLTEKPAGVTMDNDENIIFSLAEAGAVQVIYIAGETPIFKIAGNFYVEPTPEPAKFYVTGDSALLADAAGDASLAWNPAAIKAEADTLVLNLKAEQYYKLKVTADGTWNTAKGFNDLTEKPAGVTMDNDENIIFSLAEAGAVQVIYIAGETPIFKIAGNFYVAPTPPTVENGFYLVGSMNGWTASAEYKFAVNTDNENEYVLQVTLDVNDGLKVKKVEEGQEDVWYPAEGDNYIVDDHHNGATAIYFRPDYQGGEDWFAGCIYVVPTSTVGFENTAADTKAVKVLKNGILVIEKNNKVYNVLGIEMK